MSAITLRYSLSLEDRKSGEGTFVFEDLHIDSVINDLSFLFKLREFSLSVFGKTELLADSDCLSAWELKGGSLQGDKGFWYIFGLNSDGKEDISDCNSSAFT